MTLDQSSELVKLLDLCNTLPLATNIPLPQYLSKTSFRRRESVFNPRLK